MKKWVVERAFAIRGRPLGLCVLAAENCVENRPVRVRLHWFVNDTVFRKSQVIAERRVDPSATTGQVLVDLIYLLQQEVRTRALAKNMVPNDEELGRLSYDQLLRVCEEVRSRPGPVSVVARARYDTSRLGRLNVDLEVNPVDLSQAALRQEPR